MERKFSIILTQLQLLSRRHPYSLNQMTQCNKLNCSRTLRGYVAVSALCGIEILLNVCNVLWLQGNIKTV